VGDISSLVGEQFPTGPLEQPPVILFQFKSFSLPEQNVTPYV